MHVGYHNQKATACKYSSIGDICCQLVGEHNCPEPTDLAKMLEACVISEERRLFVPKPEGKKEHECCTCFSGKKLLQACNKKYCVGTDAQSRETVCKYKTFEHELEEYNTCCSSNGCVEQDSQLLANTLAECVEHEEDKEIGRRTDDALAHAYRQGVY
eukprot:TRINITY_DN41216_c0_g1_i1.p1 TRINITY_DN41216_c0_g1~~TRINITY_DN41216_c0_g1_i1.p1  ORF type:complete len:158 (+),score=9.89 TRINITY_DN41216_c0_g1_i1:91-564(+)